MVNNKVPFETKHVLRCTKSRKKKGRKEGRTNKWKYEKYERKINIGMETILRKKLCVYTTSQLCYI